MTDEEEEEEYFLQRCLYGSSPMHEGTYHDSVILEAWSVRVEMCCDNKPDLLVIVGPGKLLCDFHLHFKKSV